MTRSRATAKKAGSAWETAIVEALVTAGWIHAERRTKNGAHDRGDISGIPGIVIEAKNTNRLALAEAVDEANIERENADAAHGVAWIKRKGRSHPAHGYVVMDGYTFMNLLQEAGY